MIEFNQPEGEIEAKLYHKDLCDLIKSYIEDDISKQYIDTEHFISNYFQMKNVDNLKDAIKLLLT